MRPRRHSAAAAGSIGSPVLSHKGIFIDGRSSRLYRPVGFDPLRDHGGANLAPAYRG